MTRVAADGLNVRVKNGRLELRRNFFRVRVSSQWNLIPLHSKRMMPEHLFKRAYRRHRATETERCLSPRRDQERDKRRSDIAYRDLMHFKSAYLVHEEQLYK